LIIFIALGLSITPFKGINFEYEESAINLQPGKTFFAYTDGFIEQEVTGKGNIEKQANLTYIVIQHH